MSEYCDKLLYYRLSEWKFMQVSSILVLGNNLMVSIAFADDFRLPEQVSKICRPTGKQWRYFGGSAPFTFAFRLQKSSQVHFYILLAKKYMYVSCLNTSMTVVMRDLQNFNETMNYLKTQYWYIAFSIISLNVVITAILWIPIGVQIF